MRTLTAFHRVVKTPIAKSLGVVMLLSALTACSSGDNSSTTSTPTSSNNAPVANINAIDAIQDTNAAITLVATDADGDTLTYSLDSQTQNGALVLAGNTVTYTPNTDFSGSDSFTFKASDGTADSNAATVTITVAPVSSVSGVISKTDGTVIDGVTVQIVDTAGMTLTPQTSSTAGEFEVTAKTGSDLILSFTKPGFAKQTKTISSPSVKNLNAPMNITMLEAGATQSVDNSVAAQVSGTNGASVSFPANSFVDASGNPVSGNIDVVITPVDVSDRSVLAAFPGEFAGISETTNDRVNIVSGGTTYFDFSQSGEPLQLANGTTAEIELPLFVTDNPVTGNPVELGDTIELWYLNETTGVWVQEGTGTVVVNTDSPTGYALNANVSHFTPWNIDWPIPDFSMLDVTINGTVNGGVAILKTRTTGTNWGWLPSMTSMIVGTTQTYSIFPWSGETCVWLEYTDDTGAAATSPEQCITGIIGNTTYAMTFNIETAASLVLHNSYSRNSYRINQTPYIRFGPRSLESSVSYAITAGALPSGMSLST
ncbi:MAG: Ig-like domain-containing protein, partial [Leucothrix sp.]